MDDEYFDDDGGLDDLPSNTLQEIEARASKALQDPAAVADLQPPPSSDYGLQDDEEVIDLDAPPRSKVVTAWQNPQSLAAKGNETFQSSQHARPQDEVTQRENWRVQRYGAAAQRRLPTFRPPRPTSSTGNTVLSQLSQQVQSQQQVAQPLRQTQTEAGAQAVNGAATTLDAAALQKRVAELERAHSALIQENQSAKAQAFAKAGEISIVRANQEKTIKEYEAKLASLQELSAQETARHKAEMDAAKKDREQMETSNKFLQHDLAQETDRARHARRALKSGNENVRPRPSPASTPKKKSSLPFRDGFNDDEVIAISPSKSKEKPQPGTPTKPPSKRKRVEHDSPTKQLSFSDQDTSFQVEQGEPPVQLNAVLPLRTREKTEVERRSDLIQAVLEHRQPDDRRTIELLTALSLPSEPETTLSSSVYDALHDVQSVEKSSDCAVQFCSQMTILWVKCLGEQYCQAIPLVLSLLMDVVVRSSNEVARQTATEIVPLVVQTADLVATPRARRWMNPVANKGPDPEVEIYIKPLDCLQLMHVVAQKCVDDERALKTFWSCIEHDFILVMLHKAQPLEESISMLDVVGLSVLEHSFGAISKAVGDGEEYTTNQRQHQNEYNLVSRLANLLADKRDQQRQNPAGTEDTGVEASSVSRSDEASNDTPLQSVTSAGNELTAFDLRIAALHRLTHLCSTDHGGKMLASHRFATGRIIRFMHESILSMYDYHPKTHGLATACVNHSVMLLAHLCFVHSDTLDLRTRLAAEPSGHHKHLVALSRVAFSQGESVIEEGIWTESAEAAHRMLDEFLSPEEGDAVVSVFSSMRSNHDREESERDNAVMSV
ncbi:MAG: hypothetical protein Q9162_006406 [Coniocarpon cinnabarinum]